jgi:hypothetical protein
MAQTNYDNSPGLGFPGMLVDTGAKDAVSRVAGADIPFGRFVMNAANKTVTLVATDLSDLAGVALHQHKTPDSAGVAQYEAGEVVDVLKRGRVWVWCEQAVSTTDPVFIRVTAGSAGELVGQVRKDADTDQAVLETRAAFDSNTTGAGLVSLSINLP